MLWSFEYFGWWARVIVNLSLNILNLYRVILRISLLITTFRQDVRRNLRKLPQNQLRLLLLVILSLRNLLPPRCPSWLPPVIAELQLQTCLLLPLLVSLVYFAYCNFVVLQYIKFVSSTAGAVETEVPWDEGPCRSYIRRRQNAPELFGTCKSYEGIC
jgi:hypothetical protein